MLLFYDNSGEEREHVTENGRLLWNAMYLYPYLSS